MDGGGMETEANAFKRALATPKVETTTVNAYVTQAVTTNTAGKVPHV